MFDEIVRFLIVVPIQLVLVVGLPYAAWRWLRSRRPRSWAPPLRADGAGRYIVPAVASFTGLRGLPWLALAYNNASPLLVIGPEGITFRVLRRTERPYVDVEEVDLHILGATVSLCFSFRASALTFAVNVGGTELARAVLTLLAGRVGLSSRAEAFLTFQASD